MKEIEITITKKGIKCLWEKGGGYTNIGSAQIIADMFGEAKRPVCIRRSGELACQEHALIPVRTNDYVITVSHSSRDGDTFEINRIVEIGDTTLKCEEVTEIPACLLPAIDAGLQKASDYHCRNAYYILN